LKRKKDLTTCINCLKKANQNDKIKNYVQKKFGPFAIFYDIYCFTIKSINYYYLSLID